MKKINKKGFTLVELMVVIVILMILGTISFFSYLGLSADSRDAKRSLDLGGIGKAITITMAAGQEMKSFVSGSGSTINYAGTGTSTSTGTRIRIAGVEGYTALASYYVAGEVNYTGLGLQKENFMDPTVNIPYKIGVTDLGLDQYELAATIEARGNTDTMVSGTWNPRVSINTYTGTQNGDTFTLTGTMLVSDTNLRLGDTVRFNGNTTDNDKYIITLMEGNTFRVDRTITSLGTKIFLHGDETKHLIKRWNTVRAIDPGSGYDYTPYKIN